MPWLLALLFGGIGTISVMNPVIGIGFLTLAFVYWLTRKTVLNPVWGLFLAFWIFPWYQIFRGAMWVYPPEVPLLATRFWLEIVLFLITLSLVFRHLLGKDKARLGAQDLPVFFLLLAALYGLLITIVDVSYFSAVFGVYYSITPLVAYFVVRWIRPTLKDIGQLFSCLLASFSLFALVSFYDYVFHPLFVVHIFQVVRHAFYPGTTEQTIVEMTTSYLRMVSLLLDEDMWGAACALISLLCMARVTTGKAGKTAWFALLLSIAGLMLSMSRGAVIGWGGGVLVLAAVHTGRRLRVLMIVFGLLVAGGAGYLQIQTDARVVKVQKFIAESAPDQKGLGTGRMQQWQSGMETFSRFPSGIGVGASGFAALYTGIGQPIVTDGFYYHIAVEQGWPGLVLWAIGLPGMIVVLLARLRVTTELLLRSLGAGLVAGLVSLSIHGIVADSFDYYYTPALFFILFALFMGGTDHYVQRRPKAKSDANPSLALVPPSRPSR